MTPSSADEGAVRSAPPDPVPVEPGVGQALTYAGAANLEVMDCAVKYNAFLLRTVLRFVQPGDRILDFGAGIGTFARRLHAVGLNVSAVEPDPRQRVAVAAQGIRCEASLDAYSVASFDLVYSFNVLEHIDDDLAALRAVRARMRPGGRLFAYVPAFPFLFSSMDRNVGHLRRYTASTLCRVVEQAGFRVEQCRYADCLGIPATLAYKWLGSREGTIDTRALVAYDRFAFPVSRLLDHAFSRLGGKNVWLLARQAELPR